MFSTEIKDFKDIENDEKELEKINDMLISTPGNTDYILSTLQDCQKKYENFISDLQKEFWDIEKIINDHCLPFVSFLIGIKPNYKVVRVSKYLPPEDFIVRECWEILNDFYVEEDYLLKWSEESYNKNAKEVLDDEALEWSKVKKYLNRSYDIFDLLEKAKLFIQNSIKPLLDKLTKNISSAKDTKEVPTAPTTPSSEEAPIVYNDDEYKDKPYYKNLVRAFANFPEFKKDFPIMIKKGIIGEYEKHKNKLQWLRSDAAFAQYFFIRKKPEGFIKWTLLIDLFIGQYDFDFKDTNLKTALSKIIEDDKLIKLSRDTQEILTILNIDYKVKKSRTRKATKTSKTSKK